MLKQRVVTALILISVFSTILFWAPASVFIGFIGLVLAVAGWEWSNLCHLQQAWQRYAYTFLLVSMGVTALWLLDSNYFAFWNLQSIFLSACLWWAIALLLVQSYPSSELLWKSQIVRMTMGVMVLVPAWLGLSYLRSMPSGEWLVLSIVLVVAIADSGAYFAGKAFGKRKLAPSVSPGKSWEGALGGLIAVALVSSIFCQFHPEANLLTIAAITLPTAMVSVVGDLFESMLKRFRGVKDSSQLLPGHGGVLDRVDGLVAAIPVFSLAILISGWQW